MGFTERFENVFLHRINMILIHTWLAIGAANYRARSAACTTRREQYLRQIIAIISIPCPVCAKHTIMMGYALRDSYTDNRQCTTNPTKSVLNHRNRLETGVLINRKKTNSSLNGLHTSFRYFFLSLYVLMRRASERQAKREKIRRHERDKEREREKELKLRHCQKTDPFFTSFLNFNENFSNNQ